MDQNKNNIPLPISIIISVAVIILGVVYTLKVGGIKETAAAEVLPAEITLPVSWGDLGQQMIKGGVIDAKKFEEIYAERGGLAIEEKNLLYETSTEKIKMTRDNAGTILNLLWAFGLANKNEILEKGPMNDPGYKGAGNFASTDGWTLARGNVMDHYSMHQFVILTPEQQKLVERVSKNIYRPCCGNSTYFPDCNHGMAMLGLLELLAVNGVSENEMYKIALQVNSYWFPDTYMNIAKYMENKGVSWNKVSPKEMLSAQYSSGGGYRKILEQITPVDQKSAGGCGV